MNWQSARIAWVVGFVAVTYGLYLPASGLAQSLWPFRSGQEQEKMKAQGQAPVEQAFPKNYRKLNEKERALVGEKYDEFLKERAKSKKDESSTPDMRQIQPLELPKDPFQSPDGSKAFEGSTK